MEIIDEVFLIDGYEMLFALNAVLGRFPLNVQETEAVVLDLRGAQQTIHKFIVEDMGGVVTLAHHDIVGITGDDGVTAIELQVIDIGKEKGGATIGGERIELGNGAMVYISLAAMNSQAVAKGVGKLAIVETDVTMGGYHAVALGIMDDAAGHGETLLIGIDGGGVNTHGYLGIANLGIGKLIVLGRTLKTDARPLAADPVVRQIVEHMVETVATQNHILGNQGTADGDAGLVVEIECGVTEGEHGIILNGNTIAIDDDGLGCLDERVTGDNETVDFQGIPGIAAQMDALLYPTLEGKDDIILQELWIQFARLCGRHLDEYTDAVGSPHLKIIDNRARGIVEIRAIDIDSEARLIASFETYGTQMQPLVTMIIHPKGVGAGTYTREDSIHLDGINRESETSRRTRGERVVIGTGHKKPDTYNKV